MRVLGSAVLAMEFLVMCFALLLAKDRSTLEVANDLNGDIINLFRVANYHPEELSKEMSRLPSSRELLAHSVALLRTDALTDVQRAARFL